MRANHARIAIVLDRSGSMSAIHAATVDGFNEFIKSQKSAPGTADVMLVLFDNQYEVAWDKPLTEVQDMKFEDFQPRGYTALLDAIGRTINTIGLRLNAEPEEQRPSKVITVIITDGLENASQEFDRPKIAEMIGHQRDKYQWEFVYLGANQNAVTVGAGMNIPARASITYAATGPDARKKMRAAGAYAVGARGASGSSVMSFSADDREEAEEEK